MFKTKCPLCGTPDMIVTEAVLMATGETMNLRSVLTADGFVFDLPEGIKDGSTDKEKVLCVGCSTVHDLSDLTEFMAKPKILVASFTIQDKYYEFTSFCICEGTQRMKEENIIDRHFRDFYGKGNLEKDDYEKASQYSYLGYQVAIKKISWVEITERERALLNKVGLY